MSADDKYPHDHSDLQIMKAELATLKKEHKEMRDKMENRIWAFCIFAGSGIIALLVYIFSPILKQ